MLTIVKKNDSYDVITYQLENEDNSPIDLTGATVNFVMGKKNKLITNAQATVTSATSGIVSYQLSPSDTLISGTFLAEFVVTFANGTQKTYPSNGYITVDIEQNLDTTQNNVVVDTIAAKQGDFEAKLDSILKQGIGTTVSAMNEYTWVTTSGQTTFIFPTNAKYDPSAKWFQVLVGNVPVDNSLVNRLLTTQFSLNIDPATIKAGMNVRAMWVEPIVPITGGHHSTHEINGQDEIDLTKLRNYSIPAVACINDYGADPTGVNDSLAAFNTAIATGKPVTALPGTYKVTGTIVVTRKAMLFLNAGVTIKPSGNFNVIQIKPESKSYGNGCIIDSSALTSFTMAGIYATGQDRFNVVNELTIVDGFDIKGKDHEGDVGGVSTNYTGKGIHFYSGNNWAAGFSGQAYIAYIQVSNINISSVYRGIWLEREQAPVNGNPWITSCTFDQINMYAAMRSIDITTNDYFYNGGHLFTNLQLQANSLTERYIYTDGANSIFEGEFWDLEDYFEPRNVPCFEFSATAHENTINGTQFFSLDKHVIDRNSTSSGNPMKPNRFNSLVNPVNIMAPIITNNVRNFIGDQDDVLAGATKLYTVTKTSAHVSGGGTLDAMFQPTKGSFYSINGVDEANNCIIEIDCSTAPIAEIDLMGFIFRQDTNNYVPKYIKMDLLDSGGAVLATKTITNNTQGFVYFSTYASSTYKIRLTFGSSNDGTANRRIRIYRVFATAIGLSGKTWLNTAEGGTVYGDTNFMGYTYLGKVASLPTASATYRGKTIRVEGGTGVADNLYMCMKSATETYSWKVITTG